MGFVSFMCDIISGITRMYHSNFDSNCVVLVQKKTEHYCFKVFFCAVKKFKYTLIINDNIIRTRILVVFVLLFIIKLYFKYISALMMFKLKSKLSTLMFK